MTSDQERAEAAAKARGYRHTRDGGAGAYVEGFVVGAAESAARIEALEKTLRICDGWVQEWAFRDEKKRFFAYPNEVRVCRDTIAAALAAQQRP